MNQLMRCDRCGAVIVGQPAIVGLWASDGIRGSRMPVMNSLPAVTIKNLCPECRATVQGVMVQVQKEAVHA